MTTTTEEKECAWLEAGSGERYEKVGEGDEEELYLNQITGAYAVDDGDRVHRGKSKKEARDMFPELF